MKKVWVIIKKFWLWTLIAYCFMAFFAFMPSMASVLFLLVGVACLPVKGIKNLWNKIPIAPKVVKAVAITILFFLACGFAPTAESGTNPETPIIAQVSDEAKKADGVEDIGLEDSVASKKDVVENEESEVKTDENVEESDEGSEDNIEGATEEITTPSEVDSKSEIVETEPKVDVPVVSRPEEVAVLKGFDVKSIPSYAGEAYVIVNGNVPFFEDADLSSSSYEYYSAFDQKGRCGVCVASVGADIMPKEERGEIGSVKPSGWNQAKYPGVVDGNYLYNRCHLIGYQLAGENANEENLITGTRYLNVDGMLPFENMVADYVKETQNHVMYRVSPIFEDDNLLASGVLLEAKSVEDNGEGILFCVYCYNVQPGVAIDYANGASSLIEAPKTDDSQESESTKDKNQEASSEPAPNPEEPTKEPQSEFNYAVNNKNGKIHIIGECAATGTGDNAMTDPEYFNTYEEAEAYSVVIAPNQKKRQCGNCW